MAKNMQDKVAVVTGASNGIGRGIAEMFAAEGARTVLAARRQEVLDEVVAGIVSKGGTAMAVRTDVTTEEDVNALFAKTVNAYGRIDVVVNNAGVPTSTPTEDITLKYWNEVIAVNLTGVFLCSREAIKRMKAQKPQGGRIINIGSISAKTPRPDSLPYTATKFAIQGMTHQLTQDGRKYDIVSSVIHPGSTLSSFSLLGGRSTSGPGENPQDYIMSTDDVARVAVLMASLPGEVNLFEATILPNHSRSFISRG